MQQQSNEDAPEALMHRSATTLALLAVFTIGAFLVSLVGPTAAGAQTAPAPTTSTTEAPSTATTVPTTDTTATPATVPLATPSTTVPPATSVTVPVPAALAEPTRAAHRRQGPRSLAEATYVYTPREVHLAWNNSHRDKITLAKATRLAHYLNAVVAAQIQQYLLAVYLNAVAASVPNQANWDRVAACESGGNWHLNTGNGYYGGLQFSASTWRAVGGSGLPSNNTREEQIRRANILKDRAGLGQWPRCGRNF